MVVGRRVTANRTAFGAVPTSKRSVAAIGLPMYDFSTLKCDLTDAESSINLLYFVPNPSYYYNNYYLCRFLDFDSPPTE